MNKRLRTCLFVTLLVLLGGYLCINLLRSREPRYEGRRLSDWVDDLYNSHVAVPRRRVDEGAQGRAENAIRKLGTNCVPTLIEMLKHKNSKAKMRMQATCATVNTWIVQRLDGQVDGDTFESLLDIHIIPVTFYYDEADYRLSAAAAFDVLGPTAKPAIPALLALMHEPDPNLKTYVMIILDGIDPELARKTAIEYGFDPTNLPSL